MCVDGKTRSEAAVSKNARSLPPQISREIQRLSAQLCTRTNAHTSRITWACWTQQAIPTKTIYSAQTPTFHGTLLHTSSMIVPGKTNQDDLLCPNSPDPVTHFLDECAAVGSSREVACDCIWSFCQGTMLIWIMRMRSLRSSTDKRRLPIDPPGRTKP